MANTMATMQGCCCEATVNNCDEFWAWLATKDDIEITVTAELTPLSYNDCTDADCATTFDGTYILTKIAGSVGAGSCATESPDRTFFYTFSKTIDCTTSDDPYTGIGVDFYCDSGGVIIRGIVRGNGGCFFPYTQTIPFPADFSSGTLAENPGGGLSNPCVAAAPASYLFL